MVKKEKLEKLIPNLLTDDLTTNKRGHANYQKNKRRWESLPWYQRQIRITSLWEWLDELEKELNRASLKKKKR
jgi:hypothetical protein